MNGRNPQDYFNCHAMNQQARCIRQLLLQRKNNLRSLRKFACSRIVQIYFSRVFKSISQWETFFQREWSELMAPMTATTVEKKVWKRLKSEQFSWRNHLDIRLGLWLWWRNLRELELWNLGNIVVVRDLSCINLLGVICILRLAVYRVSISDHRSSMQGSEIAAVRQVCLHGNVVGLRLWRFSAARTRFVAFSPKWWFWACVEWQRHSHHLAFSFVTCFDNFYSLFQREIFARFWAPNLLALNRDWITRVADLRRSELDEK